MKIALGCTDFFPPAFAPEDTVVVLGRGRRDSPPRLTLTVSSRRSISPSGAFSHRWTWSLPMLLKTPLNALTLRSGRPQAGV
jgi:hypothetical protein